MKKFLLGYGCARSHSRLPAAAADWPRVPTPRRPLRWSPPCMTGAASTSASTAAGVRSRKCWDIAPITTVIIGGSASPFPVAEGCHDASGGTVGGQIGYRWQAGTWVFGLEAQGNWADLTGSSVSTFACLCRTDIQPLQDRCDSACSPARSVTPGTSPALREGRRGRHRRQIRAASPPRPACVRHRSPPPKPAGAAWSESARIRLLAELVGRARIRPLFMGQPRHHLQHGPCCRSVLLAHRSTSVRTSICHRPRQLSLGRPGRREVLIFD